jgi:hypothetical protein
MISSMLICAQPLRISKSSDPYPRELERPVHLVPCCSESLASMHLPTTQRYSQRDSSLLCCVCIPNPPRLAASNIWKQLIREAAFGEEQAMHAARRVNVSSSAHQWHYFLVSPSITQDNKCFLVYALVHGAVHQGHREACRCWSSCARCCALVQSPDAPILVCKAWRCAKEPCSHHE